MSQNVHDLTLLRDAILQVALDCIITLDAAGRVVDWNPAAEQTFGYTHAEVIGVNLADLIIPVHLRDAHNRGLQRYVQTRQARLLNRRIELEALHKDGHVFPIELAFHPIHLSDDVYFTAYLRNLTSQRAAQERTAALHRIISDLAGITNATQAALAILEHLRAATGAYGGTILRLEQQAFVTVGTAGYASSTVEPFRTFPLDTKVPVADAVRELRPIYLNQQQITEDYPLVAGVLLSPDERLAALPLEINGECLGGLVLSFTGSRDFTADEQDFIGHVAHQCALALDRFRLQEREQQHQRRLQFLVDASARLSTSLDLQQTLRTLSRLTVPALADICILYTLNEHGQLLPIEIAHSTPEKVAWVEELLRAYPVNMTAPYGAAQVMLTGTPNRMSVMNEDILRAVALDEENFRLLHRLAPTSGLNIPLLAQGRVIGLLELFTTDPARTYSDDDLMLAVELAGRAGAALENARLHAQTTANEARFRGMFEQAAVGIAHIGLGGEWLSVNQRLCDIVGYTAEELLGLTFQDITYPEDLEADLGHVQQLMRGERDTYAMHKRYLRKQGDLIWINLTVSIVRGPAREPLFFISVVEDITELKEAEAKLRQAHEQLEVRVEQRTGELHALSEELHGQVEALEQYNREADLMGELMEMLLACFTREEATEVVATYATQLFPQATGALYSFGPSRNVLERQRIWNGVLDAEPIFAPEDCWGLRRGRLFTSTGLHCRHDGSAMPTLCVPLLAQGETVGLLHLGAHSDQAFTPAQQALARRLAEGVALALVNLNLRETLRQQSIRDGLTGLFNRRYLEETFEREARRALRQQAPMSLIMLDVDHFKTLNDTQGHEGGDLVLKALGQLLKTSVRAEDLACRYGGEEFALLLPGATLEQAAVRAECIRAKIAVMQVQKQGQDLGPIHASLGVAALGQHGTELGEVMRAADFALYQAKQEGRNRVVCAR